MIPIRTLIVDDEPAARELLRSMLAAHPEFELVAEAKNGKQALQRIRQLSPDLVLLDVQMPEMDGLQVLRSMNRIGAEPVVIFVTAFDRFAVAAFEAAAVDYLLKPFSEARLATALSRAKKQVSRGTSPELRDRVLRLFTERSVLPEYIQRIPVREGDRILLLAVSDLEWVEAAAKYTRLHHDRKSHLLREGISQLERELDPRIFVRVSRSAIVNINRIREVHPWFQGDYTFVMESGSRVQSTRGHRDAVHALLKRKGRDASAKA